MTMQFCRWLGKSIHWKQCKDGKRTIHCKNSTIYHWGKTGRRLQRQQWSQPPRRSTGCVYRIFTWSNFGCWHYKENLKSKLMMLIRTTDCFWVQTLQTANHIIPWTILEASIKMTSQWPPSGVFANLHKALDSLNKEALGTSSKKPSLKVFALSLLLPCSCDREKKFKAQDWDNSYPLNTGDLIN